VTWLFTEVGAASRNTVGWLMVPAGGTCPGKGVAVKVMAPALGVTDPSLRALIPMRGSLSVIATPTPSAVTAALGGSPSNSLSH